MNLASIMERADEALLPAVYKEVGEALHTTPTGLGSLTMYRSMVQALCYPLAAYVATRYYRCHVIALGAFLWALATFLVAISTTFVEAVAISRGLNGIGLALVIPAIQSLVADSTDDVTRGSAFGWLAFTSFIGSILGGTLSFLLASTTFFGIAGWRIAFLLVAIISTIAGFLVWSFAVDPLFLNNDASLRNKEATRKSTREEVKDLVKVAKDVVKIGSFQIFVTQGVAISFPWSAFAFMPMWFELIGFSHEYTAVLMASFFVAFAIGSFFGGKMGDFLAKRFPDAGRIVMSQISTGSVIPVSSILFLGLKDDASTGVLRGTVLFVLGFTISLHGAATNGPLFAEIVQEKSRTSVYALDRFFESIFSSFAPPVVGVLAEHVFGYKSGDNNKSGNLKKNGASLAKALYTAISIPMLICSSLYSFLYCSYPRDRDQARMDSLITSDNDQTELVGNDYRFRNFELGEDDEIDVIDMDDDENC
ncbi:hypothetical protein LUZ60_003027 [Juncus effusus]|nr:hypothetical protein LUZ60_003027 [Juncus effusus]